MDKSSFILKGSKYYVDDEKIVNSSIHEIMNFPKIKRGK